MISDKTCRACKSKLTKERIVQLAGMPNAVQNLPTDKEAALKSGITLDVRQCSCCGLVQLTNDPVPYYKDVIRAGSFSPSMKVRQRDEFESFIDYFSLRGKNILEIGCGRGEYLSLLNELPVSSYGLENNEEYRRIARERGLRAYKGYPVDLNAPPENMNFDAFISINFLEHAPNPCEFLRHCSSLISENGTGLIAVPDFEFELRDNYLFSFMIDHLSYFSCTSLRNILELSGFEAVQLFRNEKLNVVTAYVKKRQQFDCGTAKDKYAEFITTVNNYVDSRISNGKRIAVWGASHLAFSIISASQTGEKFTYIVDSARFKQGRYSPASGLQIFPPEHLREDPVDSILIMCPEYSDEIVSSIKKNFASVVQHIATFKNSKLEVIQ